VQDTKIYFRNYSWRVHLTQSYRQAHSTTQQGNGSWTGKFHDKVF